MDKHHPRMIISIIFVFLFIALSSCNENDFAVKVHGARVPHLYGFNRKQLQDCLARLGYSNSRPYLVRRDSQGNALYIYSTNRNVLRVYRDGKIAEMTPPAKAWAINDTGEFISYQDVKRALNFKKDGYHSFDFYVDFSGQFFSIGYVFGKELIDGRVVTTGSLKHLTIIARTDSPNNILHETDIWVRDIFCSNEKVYLFAYEQEGMVCQVLKINDEQLELIEERNIPYPYSVVDLDPWSENLLLLDVHDVPFHFLTSWYLFNLETGQITKIGRARDYGFFLNADIPSAICHQIGLENS